MGDRSDDDSLFGSPDVSPTVSRGRSPSPFLALPSAVGEESSCGKNVGTIALPGLHDSEHIVSQPALPTNISTSEVESSSRPPAHSSQSQDRDNWRKKKKRRKKDTGNRHALELPPIRVPDPGQPRPANFLRNQPGLLGIAGHFVQTPVFQPTPKTGTSASFPIVIEDEEAMKWENARVSTDIEPQITKPDPRVQRQNRELNLQIRRMERLLKPPSALRAPHGSDPSSANNVLVELVRDANFLPTLQALRGQYHVLKELESKPTMQPIAKLPTKRPVSPLSTLENGEPSKKRKKTSQKKLPRIPAGAELWDRPFSFPWDDLGTKRTRAEQQVRFLLGELVDAVRRALHRTATCFKASSRSRKRIGEFQPVNSHQHAWLSSGSSSRASTPPPATPEQLNEWLDSLTQALNGDAFSDVDRMLEDSMSGKISSSDQDLADEWLSLLDTVPDSMIADDPSIPPMTINGHSAPKAVSSSFENFLAALEPSAPLNPAADTQCLGPHPLLDSLHDSYESFPPLNPPPDVSPSLGPPSGLFPPALPTLPQPTPLSQLQPHSDDSQPLPALDHDRGASATRLLSASNELLVVDKPTNGAPSAKKPMETLRAWHTSMKTLHETTGSAVLEPPPLPESTPFKQAMHLALSRQEILNAAEKRRTGLVQELESAKLERWALWVERSILHRLAIASASASIPADR